MTKQNDAAGTALATTDENQYAVMESLAMKGDLSGLNAVQKTQYLEKLCNSLGLNPLTQPFLPLKLNGKEILYASRGCTDQLAHIHKLTREIIKTERIEDVFIATCKVTGPDSRFDISTGAVTIGSLKGDNLANALMKAETKAKRRATLSFCGLGFLDESEIETIPREKVEYPATKGQLVERAQTGSQQVAGQTVPNGEAFTGSSDGQRAVQEGQWAKNIDSLSRFVGIDPQPTINFFNSNPDRREECYAKVLREVVKKIVNGDSWAMTEDGTTAYLEKVGITEIDKGTRGQFEQLIDQMRTDGLLASQ